MRTLVAAELERARGGDWIPDCTGARSGCSTNTGKCPVDLVKHAYDQVNECAARVEG